MPSISWTLIVVRAHPEREIVAKQKFANLKKKTSTFKNVHFVRSSEHFRKRTIQNVFAFSLGGMITSFGLAHMFDATQLMESVTWSLAKAAASSH